MAATASLPTPSPTTTACLLAVLLVAAATQATAGASPEPDHVAAEQSFDRVREARTDRIREPAHAWSQISHTPASGSAGARPVAGGAPDEEAVLPAATR